MPGNVRLRKGEANVRRACVVNVSQLLTIDRTRLDRPLGALNHGRMREVLQGLALLFGTESRGGVNRSCDAHVGDDSQGDQCWSGNGHFQVLWLPPIARIRARSLEMIVALSEEDRQPTFFECVEDVGHVRQRIAEIIDWADQDAMDLGRARRVEQEVLDLIDEPAAG